MVNTDVAAKPGEHWLALYAPRDFLKIEMFDSFGLPPNIYFCIHLSFIFLVVAFNHLVARFMDIMHFYLSILNLEIIHLIIQSII